MSLDEVYKFVTLANTLMGVALLALGFWVKAKVTELLQPLRAEVQDLRAAVTYLREAVSDVAKAAKEMGSGAQALAIEQGRQAERIHTLFSSLDAAKLESALALRKVLRLEVRNHQDHPEGE
jgi:hypothetical protein